MRNTTKQIPFYLIIPMFFLSCEADEAIKVEEAKTAGVIANLTDQYLFLRLFSPGFSDSQTYGLEANEIYSTYRDKLST